MKILLGTLAFSNPDLLDKCLYSWPDTIDKLVLWQGMDAEEDKIDKVIFASLSPYLLCLRKLNNYGFAGGCNILMRYAFDVCECDGIVLVGSDTEMLNGFWESFTENLNKYDFVESSHQFNCFYISRKAYDIVGTFDENFFPSYVEDDDYRIRVIKSGIKYKTGEGKRELLLHEGSATVRRNSMYQAKSYRSFQLNKEYMHRKWGGTQDSIPKWKPVYETPFDIPTWPLDRWILEPEGRIKRLWHNIVNDPADKRLVPLLNCLNGRGTYDNNTKEI